MKKALAITVIAAAAAAAVSCSIDPIAADSARRESLVDISFKAQADESTRAAFQGQCMAWEEGDSIAVWDGAEIRVFRATAVEGATATFCGAVADTATHFAVVFPYSACRNVTDTEIAVRFPATQTIEEGRIADPEAFVSTARTTDLAAGVTLSNAVSLVKFTLGTEGVSNVSFCGNAEEAICGNAKIDTEGSASGMTGTSVTVIPASGAFAGGSYYAAVAPSSLETGVNLAYSTADGRYLLSSANALALPRNGIADLGTVTSNARKKALPKTISSVAEMLEFGEYSKWYTSGDNVTLAADIDMSGQTWTAADFAGSFDGCAHSVYNLNLTAGGSCGFFGTVTGTVKNLSFGKEGQNDSKITCTATPAAGTTVAPILVLSGEGRLEGITSHCTVEYAADTTSNSLNIAGIVARTTGGASVISCTNKGDVSVKLTTRGFEFAVVSGVIGYCYAGAPKEITGCRNAGKISILSPLFTGKALYLGGIVGRLYKSGSEINDCHNSGDLTNTAYCTNCYIGGICSITNTAETNFTSCSNSGSISCSGNSSHASDGSKSAPDFALGGIIGFANVSSTVSGCSNSGSVLNTSKTNKKGNISTVGGIVGGWWNGTATISDCTNTGAIEDSSAPTSSNPSMVGGITGRIATAATITGCTNSGTLTRGGTKTSGTVSIGGICAAAPSIAPVIAGCRNLSTGTITLSASSTSAYIGGILGGTLGAGAQIDSCGNEAAITQTAACSSGSYVGGIVSNFSEKTAAATVKNCSNSGNMLNKGTVTSYFRWGGICGNASGAKTFTSCTNTGNVTNESATTKEIKLAGIIASNTDSGSTLTECINRGDISSTTTSGTVTAMYLGGIAGSNNSGTFKTYGCITTGDVTATVGATCTTLYAAGAIGSSAGLTMTGCKIRSTVTTAGTFTNKYAAMMIGSCTTTAGPTINTTGYAGSLDGTAITVGNWNNVDYICANKPASGNINVSGDADSNYLWAEE